MYCSIKNFQYSNPIISGNSFCRNVEIIFFSKYTLLQTFLIQFNIYLPTGIKIIGQTKFCIMYCSIKNFQYSYPIISGIFLGTFVYFLFFCKYTKKSSKLIHVYINLPTGITIIGQTKFCIMYLNIKSYNIRIQLFLEFFGNLCIFFIFL